MTHHIVKTLLLSAMAVGAVACTSVPNVMDIPANFQEKSDKIRITGARAWKLWGKINLEDVEGKYQRRASTTTWFETFETKKAKAKFDIQVLGDQVQARCVMKQKKIFINTRQYGKIGKYLNPSIVRSPMKYACDFEGSNIPADAAFVLGQAQANNVRLFDQDVVKRFGYMDWDGTLLEFESGHRINGADPSFLDDIIPAMGYFIYEGSEMVATVDLEGKQFLYIDPAVSAKSRKAILIATTALVLHTDPAE